LSNNIFQTAEIIKKVFKGRKLSDVFRELENNDNLNILKALTYSVLRNYDETLFYYNKLVKNKKDLSDKYFFVTNNGRWNGFVEENILKKVPIKKWERNFVGDFKKPIDSFETVSYNDKLWRTIERLEETNEGFLLVLNAADIPLGIIDRSKIGNFVLNKLGFNLPSDIVNKLNFKNHYPLGIELPRIINSMKQKGDL